MKTKTFTRIAIGLIISMSLISWLYLNTHVSGCFASAEAVLPDTTQPIENKPDVSIITAIIKMVVESLPTAG